MVTGIYYNNTAVIFPAVLLGASAVEQILLKIKMPLPCWIQHGCDYFSTGQIVGLSNDIRKSAQFSTPYQAKAQDTQPYWYLLKHATEALCLRLFEEPPVISSPYLSNPCCSPHLTHESCCQFPPHLFFFFHSSLIRYLSKDQGLFRTRSRADDCTHVTDQTTHSHLKPLDLPSSVNISQFYQNIFYRHMPVCLHVCMLLGNHRVTHNLTLTA